MCTFVPYSNLLLQATVATHMEEAVHEDELPIPLMNGHTNNHKHYVNNSFFQATWSFSVPVIGFLLYNWLHMTQLIDCTSTVAVHAAAA